MSPREIPARLTALRGELKRHGLTGFLVPRADEHQGEYVAPHAERLRWISGFTGSAGLAAIFPTWPRSGWTAATPSRSATRCRPTCSRSTT